MTSLFRRAGVVVFGIMLIAASVRGQQSVTVPTELVYYPDLIIYNGKIVTMDDASLNNSPGRTFEAMAIRDDIIQFLGNDTEVLRFAGPQTRKIDLQGKTVAPGMIDTHNHLHNGAVSNWARENPEKIEAIARQFNVGGQSFADLTKGIELVIKEQMANPLPGQWAMIGLTGRVTGLGGLYLDTQQMNRETLDEWAPDLPVVVMGSNKNTLINTAARNDFLMYYEVEPTDENEENALTMGNIFSRSIIADRYFDANFDELPGVLEDYLRLHTAGGYTTYSSHIQGMRYMPAFRQLSAAGQMPIRFAFAHRYCQSIEPNQPGCFLRLGDWQGLGNKFFWNVGMTLGGLDAGPPTICTTMEAPPRFKEREYCIIQPGNNYYRAIQTALGSRYRYVVNHLYGDLPLDYLMDIIDQLIESNPSFTLEFVRSLRISSDHCGFYPRPSQLPRAKRLGMMFSCNAGYVNRSAPWLTVYGADKANRISPVGSMIKAGIMPTSEMEGLRYSSGEGPTPWAVNYEFITRRNSRGELIAPEEAVDRVTVMKMATTWASHYVLKEKEIGSLELGKWADFVVYNKDFFTIPQDEIPTVYPLMVVLGGKTVVLRDEWAQELGAPAVGPQIKFLYERPYSFAPDPEEVLKQAEMGG